MIINAELLRQHNPCPDGIARFESLYPNFNDKLSAAVKLSGITNEDKFWAAIVLLPRTELVDWAIRCGELVLSEIELSLPGDTRAKEALDIAKRVNREELEVNRNSNFGMYEFVSDAHKVSEKAEIAANMIAFSVRVANRQWHILSPEGESYALSVLISFLEERGY